MDHLISQYPLTRNYLVRLSEKTGKPMKSVVVSTITARGYMEVIRYFWSLNSETVYLPVLELSGWPLLAPLQILSMLIRTPQRLIVEPDFSFREFGFFDAFVGGLQMAWGAIAGGITVVSDWLRLGRLLKARRILARDTGGNGVLYLKTNLWLGIQAGGSVAHTSGVVQGLLEHDYAVEFASVETPVNLPQNEALNIQTISPQKTYVIPREFNHYRHNSRFTNSVSQLFLKQRDFIYQRLSLGNYAGVVLSRRYGIPLVIEYNGSELWLASNWGTPLTFEKLAIRAENACLRHAHLVVTVSDVLRDELIERGVEPNRIVSYPNGVDTNLFNPGRFTAKDVGALRAKYRIPGDALLVTFVGTFGPWHGAEVFAETIGQMVTSDSAWLESNKLHFLFIGDGVKRPLVEKLTGESPIRKYVTITGLVDQEETPLHLAASDILVSPHVPNPDGSPFFGSPTKLFEYLASGRPVIGSDLGQIGEVLQGCPHVNTLDRVGKKPTNGACGILVEPGSGPGLAAAMKFLVENPDWRKTVGENARQRAIDRYTWTSHVEAVLAGLQRSRSLDTVPAKVPIRVLFNGLHSKTGGGLTYFKNILPFLADDREIEFHVCIHEDQRDFLPKNQSRLNVHYLDFPQGFWRLQFKEQTDIPRLARKIDADVTFSPANYGPLIVPNSVILLRNALSVAFVERRPAKLAYWALVYFGTLMSLLASQRAITVSEYARRAAGGGLIGLFRERLTVVPHGVSEIFLPPKKGARRDKFLLAVSDLYVQKNLKNLICAMAYLESGNSDVTLKIAGRPVDEEYFTELKETVRQEKLDGKVEFLGEMPPEALVGLYQRCAVFVFPSTIETFGNPLVEAMACGAPIASSHSAAMPEVVGDAALFFDPLSVENMANVIDRMLKNPKLRRKLSQKAIARASDFSWQKTAEKTLAIIKEAASS